MLVLRGDLESAAQVTAMLPAAEQAKFEAERKKSMAYFTSEEYLSTERARIQQGRARDDADFAFLERLWNEQYPADSRVLVAWHLRDFLAAEAWLKELEAK